MQSSAPCLCPCFCGTTSTDMQAHESLVRVEKRGRTSWTRHVDPTSTTIPKTWHPNQNCGRGAPQSRAGCVDEAQRASSHLVSRLESGRIRDRSEAVFNGSCVTDVQGVSVACSCRHLFALQTAGLRGKMWTAASSLGLNPQVLDCSWQRRLSVKHGLR